MSAGMGRCDICKTDVRTTDLLSHISVYHPDLYEPIETWPDGQPVVIDTTLEPEDFAYAPLSDADSAVLLAAVSRPSLWQRIKSWFRKDQ
jgi:hypothetical protein